MKTVVEFPDRSGLAAEAAEWLIRMDADEPPDAATLEELQEWMQRSPAHRAELERLAGLWQRLNVLTDLAVPLGRPAGSAAHSAHAVPNARFRTARPSVLLACAVTLLAVGLVAVTRLLPPVDFQATNGLYATTVGQQSSTMLADGSSVDLNTNSQLRVEYGEEFRNVHLLQGEALFTVAKDSGRPFRVYAGNGRIQAIGTAFSVYLDGANVNVTVADGKVSLASIDRSRALASSGRHSANRRDDASEGTPDDEFLTTIGTIAAGEIALLPPSSPAPASAGLTRQDIIMPVAPDELAQRLAWRNGVLMFSGDTLEEVVREVNRYTTVQIDIPDATIRNMRIGGRLPVGETAAMLAALETNFNLQVTHLGNDRVVLTAAEH